MAASHPIRRFAPAVRNAGFPCHYSRSGARGLTGQIDPLETFMTAPTDRRVSEKAVIRARLLVVLKTGSRQLVEQRL
jgi:hypothetical protein